VDGKGAQGIKYVLLFLLALVARQGHELLVLLSLSCRHCDFGLASGSSKSMQGVKGWSVEIEGAVMRVLV
jgi:hypothetical protein